jgi:pectinesterase
MKDILKILLTLLLITAGSLTAADKKLVVRVSNPLNIERPGELVVVRWSSLQGKLASLEPANVAVYEKNGAVPIISQIVDYDQDGKPEEIVFQSNFKAKEVKEFVVKQAGGDREQITSLTYAGFMVPREDLAWENDRIAFRMYGPAMAKDVNNGIDVWTKRVRYLIVKKWYEGEEKEPKISYHEDHGEGADYFSVGRTLGVGACALIKGDSLYQPGVFQKYRIIAAGPLMAIFELTYNPFEYEGKKITQVVRIALGAGVNLNKIDVTFSAGSAKGKVPFAAGIVKRKGTATFSDKKAGCVGLWGLTTDKEEVGYLGTGLVMPRSAMRQIKEDNVHVLIRGSADLGEPTTYYTGAGWTLSKDFTTADSWNTYLTNFAKKVAAPLVVNVSMK